MKQNSAADPPLSAHRAFVVQLRAEIDIAQGRFAGRIEHVVSGQATQFHSLAECLAFITRVLTALDSALREASPDVLGRD